MNLNLNYDECIKYIRDFLREKRDKLMPHQELMLKAWCDGKIVRTGRGIERTFAADLLGKYIAHKIDSENDAEEPDVILTFHNMIGKDMITEEAYEKFKESVGVDEFNKDFLCKY